MDRREYIKVLLGGAKNPDQEFVRSGANFGEVYAMAAGLYAATTGSDSPAGPVCLAVTDKAVLAAALLASLAGGPTLLLPHALSAQSLSSLKRLTRFTAAIADDHLDFPEGTKIIRPQPGNPAELTAGDRVDPGAELLKIFTGGSTGAPQIWSKTGENIFGEGFALARHYSVNQKDVILATVPPYHIYGLLFSVVLPLVSSAAVIDHTPSYPGEIAAALQDQATILVSIPPHYRAMRERKVANPALRLAFSSAGMLDAEDNESFTRMNNLGVVEVYGSTETGGIAHRNRSLGKNSFTAFPEVSWKIRDQLLCVRSPYLSPELTLADDGFFATSDRVEVTGNNDFALRGRVDAVTKVGGKRVDLEEVRAIIRRVPGVSDCVVIALPEAGGREHRIMALVQGAGVEGEVIRKIMSKFLESYARPRVIKTTDQIPLKANGKYDRDKIIRILGK